MKLNQSPIFNERLTSAADVSIIWVAASTAAASTGTVSGTGATWTAGACKLSTFTDHAITSGASTQQPAVKTGQPVCACPSSVLLDVPSGGSDTASPCAGFTSAQGDLEVVTNACPTATSNSKIKRKDEKQYPAVQPWIPEITKTARPMLKRGAKFRRASVDGSYSLTISGAVPCESDSSVYENPSTASPTSGANPTQASLCVNSGVNANEAAYSQYNVNFFISSAFESAASANGQVATDPSVDAGSIRAGKSWHQTYQQTFISRTCVLLVIELLYVTDLSVAVASTIACSAVLDASGGATVVVQDIWHSMP